MPKSKPSQPQTEPKGQQPEALATFAKAAKSGEGKKPKSVGQTAIDDTKPLPADPKKEEAVATNLLNKAAKGKKPDPAAATRDLPDRTRTAKPKG